MYEAGLRRFEGKERVSVVIKDVFISYKAEELNEARWVRNALESCGISCWMAPDSIVGGTSYAQEIPAAIRGCKVFVLILSRLAQTSKWVPRELDQAINDNKIIMPFMLENCTLRDDFSFYLTNVQRYAAYEDKMAAMEKMALEIRGILGKGAPGYDPAPPRQPFAPEPPKAPEPPRRPVSPPPRRPQAQAGGKWKPKRQKETICVASLVLSILNIALIDESPGACGFLGLLAALLAVWGLKRLIKRSGSCGGKGLAVCGFVFGALMALAGLGAAFDAGAVTAVIAVGLLTVLLVKRLIRLKGK